MPDTFKSSPHSHVGRQLFDCMLASIDNVGCRLYVKDTLGRYVFANAAAAKLFGVGPGDMAGHRDVDFTDSDGAAAAQRSDLEVLREGRCVHADETFRLKNGAIHHLRTLKFPLFDEHRKQVGLFGLSSGAASSLEAVQGLLERNTLLGTILTHVDAAVYLKDEQGRYLYANRRLGELFGCAPEEILWRTDGELVAPDVAERFVSCDRQAMRRGTRQVYEETLRTADGATRYFWTTKMPVHLGQQERCLLGLSTEVTEMLELRSLVEHQRLTDALTGLPNRCMLERALAAQLQAHERDELAVVLFDVDHFKYINNALGQACGDQLIQQIALRLQHCRVPGAQVGRLSGDGFGVVLRHAGEPDSVAAVVETMRAGLSHPYTVSGETLHVTFSAGISLARHDAGGAAELLGHAEAALYAAKDSGRDQSRFYSAQLGASFTARMALERDLRASLHADQFELHYQPKVLRNGTVAGFEALLRWHRPGHGLVSPDQFIPLAEQLGLIVPIGRWVIAQACEQAAAWRRGGFGQIPVAVNLSASQLAQPELPAYIFNLLNEHGIGHGGLEVELTESALMADPEQATATLQALSEGGVFLSIDDFGTGFSSMAYLRQLPVTCLKLDRAFVRDIATDSRDADLCAGIMALAHRLNLCVVAEGVEDDAQFAALASSECDVFQGFLFSRPLDADAATGFLRARR